MSRLALAVVWLLACLAPQAAAQREGPAARPTADSADALVLDHDFVAGVGASSASSSRQSRSTGPS